MKRNLVVGIALLLMGGAWCWYTATHDNSPHFAVIIPSYNNIRWYTQNLDSLRMQRYTNWHAVYINDCSTDGTGDAVRQYIADHNLHDKIRLVDNTMRRGALANLYTAIHATDDNHVVVTLDGDDWLASPDALTVISRMYEDKNTWLTYGSYVEHPSGRVHPPHAIPSLVTDHNAYRRYTWLSTHMRTFYAWLFKRIKKEDLQKDGDFYAKTGDMACMFPMLEMASHHARWCDTIVYVYNLENPINDWKEDLQLVLVLDREIRAKKPYEKLA